MQEDTTLFCQHMTIIPYCAGTQEIPFIVTHWWCASVEKRLNHLFFVVTPETAPLSWLILPWFRTALCHTLSYLC